MLIYCIIGALICAVGLTITKVIENFRDISKPPRGYMQHKGFNIKLPDNPIK